MIGAIANVTALTLLSLPLIGSAAFFLYRLFLRYMDRTYGRNLKGRAIVITGCDSGFGEELAIKCASEGMHVYASVLQEASIGALREKCAAHTSGNIFPFQMDITSEESVAAGLDYVAKALPPGEGIHGLVNNAGDIIVGYDDWVGIEDYEHMWQLNVLGHIRVTHAFRDLVRLVRGRIVYMASTSGRVAVGAFGPYSVSKFAIEAYADTIRREMAQFGVLVSIIEPGYHRTPLTGRIVASFEKAWAKASDANKKLYGGEEFHSQFIGVNACLLGSPAINSNATCDVVNAYHHALTAYCPRMRYTVGELAKYRMIPLSWLCAELQDFYISRFFFQDLLKKAMST